MSEPPSELSAQAENPEPAAEDISDDTLQKKCDLEWDRYYKERDEWQKRTVDAEKEYDALLVAISTLAVGGIMAKDWSGRGHVAFGFMIVAFIGFVGCLLCSLAHRYLTYYTHKKWVNVVDEEFKNWEPDAMQRADAKYDSLPFVRRVESLKLWAAGALFVGILGAFVLMLAASNPPPTQVPQNVSQVVNVNPK